MKDKINLFRDPAQTQSLPPSRLRAGLPLALLMGVSGVCSGVTTNLVGTGAEWHSHGGNLDGTRYSELDEINTGNVGSLVLERTFQTGVNGSHMGAPLVVGSTLFAVTPYPNKLIAFDLATGATQWTFSPSVKEYARGVNCCDSVNRGPAYENGLVVYTTLDDTLVAVNAVTGKQAWRTTLADPHTGITTNAAVLIVPQHDSKGAVLANKWMVLVGSSSGEMAERGWVKGVDLTTGKLIWTGFTAGPDADVKAGPNYKPFYGKDKSANQGVNSWGNGDQQELWRQAGSSHWGFPSGDGQGHVFWGTSQPGTWNADQRPGDNKWGASILTRNATTGDLIWAYQTTPHDYWDYDAIAESTPLDLVDGITTGTGNHKQVVVHFDKNGFAYTMDRNTGEVLSAPKYGPVAGAVNWADHIDLTTGLPVYVPGDPSAPPPLATHQGIPVHGICPSALGVHGWEPTAFSAKTGMFYVPTFNFCMNYEGLKAEYVAGAPYMGMDLSITLGPAGMFSSEMVGYDIINGRVWSHPEAAAIYGGTLATKGDLVIYPTSDNKLHALNANTGDELWTATLADANNWECSSVGSPITFTGPDGHQRIAIFGGVGALAGGFSASGKPCPGPTGFEDAIRVDNGGGRVFVFKKGP